MPRVRLNYAFKVYLFAAIIGFVSASVIAFSTYKTQKKNVVDQLRSELALMVKSIALNIDGDTHEEIFSFEGEIDGLEYFEAIQSHLIKFRDIYKMPHSDGHSPLYTLRKSISENPGEEFEFVVMTNVGEGGEYFTGAYLASEPHLQEALKGEFITTDLYQDAYGTWISSAAPIYSSDGEIVGLLQGDRDIGFVMAEIAELRNTIIMQWLVGFGMSMILTTFFVRYVVSPLIRLKNIMNAFRQGEKSSRIKVDRNDEMGDVYAMYNELADSIIKAFSTIEEHNRTLEAKVEARTLALKEKNRNIQSMLKNIQQGIFTIGADSTVQPEYSQFLETIFQTDKIEGRSIHELIFSNSNLGADVIDQVRNSLSCVVGTDALFYECNDHLLVRSMEITTPKDEVKMLEMDWVPILDEDDMVEKVMVVIRDVTELTSLQQVANEQERALEITGEILNIKEEKFIKFINNSIKFLDKNEEIIRTYQENQQEKNQELIAALFRNMHTIKGSARTYGLNHLCNIVHDTESEYDALRKDEDAKWDFDQLLGQLQLTRSCLDEYITINRDKLRRTDQILKDSTSHQIKVFSLLVEEALTSLQSVQAKDSETIEKTLHHVNGILNLSNTNSIVYILSNVITSIRSLAKLLEKEIPYLNIQDQGYFVKSEIAMLLEDVLMHIFSNTMDHGLETASERLAIGKSPIGTVHLDLRATSDDFMALYVKDDGRGLNLKKIKQLACSKGLLPDPDSVTPLQLGQLIFESGLSTSKNLTQISGRGVGMNSVKHAIEEKGGQLDLTLPESAAEDDTGVPFEIRILLPKSYFIKNTFYLS